MKWIAGISEATYVALLLSAGVSLEREYYWVTGCLLTVAAFFMALRDTITKEGSYPRDHR